MTDLFQISIAVILGIIAAIGSYRVIRDYSSFNSATLPLALCFGGLTGLGVMQLKEQLSVLTLPWVALGICMLLLPLIRLIFDRSGKGTAPPKKRSDLSSKSKSAASAQRPTQNEYKLGNLLPPQNGG